MEQEKENREDARKQLDSDTKIKVAMINAEAKMIDADENNDGYVDNTDRSEVARLDAVDRDRTAREKNQADLQLKREELAEKKRTNKANENIINIHDFLCQCKHKRLTLSPNEHIGAFSLEQMEEFNSATN